MIWALLLLLTSIVLAPLFVKVRHHTHASWRLRIVSCLGVFSLPLLAFTLYIAEGSPTLESFPYVPKSSEGISLADALKGAENRLANDPMNGKGWDLIAPVYFRLGRLIESCAAYEKAILLLGETATRLADYGEACSFAGQEGITPKHREIFEQALRLDPQSLKAHFYLAQAAQLDGDYQKASKHIYAIADLSPPDAPWIEFMKKIFAEMVIQK
jgi:cytochrome c-type biogenesis protein CcmH